MHQRLLNFGFVFALLLGSTEIAFAEEGNKPKLQTIDNRSQPIDLQKQTPHGKIDEYVPKGVVAESDHDTSKLVWEGNLDKEVRKRFVEALSKHSEIDTFKLPPIEVAYCIDKNRKINHIFFLGLKGPVKEIVTEVLQSLNGDKLLDFSDQFFVGRREEVDMRFNYPAKEHDFKSRGNRLVIDGPMYYDLLPKPYQTPPYQKIRKKSVDK